MHNTFSFSHFKASQFVEIRREEEENIKLSEIIKVVKNSDSQDNYLYLIKSSTYDWKFLNRLRKLEFGRTMTFDGNKKADERAFIMKDCEMTTIGAVGCVEGKIEFNSVEDRVMKTNLFFSCDIYLQNFVKFGILGEKSKDEKAKFEEKISYNFTEFGKVSLEFGNYLEPTSEFIKEVENAINLKDPKKFKKITEKFGQYIPTKVILGGRAYYRELEMLEEYSKENGYVSTINTSGIASKSSNGKSNSYKTRCSKLIGGAQPASLKKFDEYAWIQSLKDYRNWDCIEFQKPIGIFQLLPDHLRKQVISSLGKRILYSNIKPYEYSLAAYRRWPQVINLDIPSHISEIIQIKDNDCSIFATVIDTEKPPIISFKGTNCFSCQVLCMPDADPKLIIHCIQKEIGVRDCKLKIGWMVIGYYKDLNFITDFDVQLKITKIDFNATSNSQSMFDKEYLDFEHNSLINKIPCIGIPVLEKLDSSNMSLVIGHHFFDDQEKNRIGSYTFSYCLEKNHYVNLPKFKFYTLSIKNYHPNTYGTLYFNQNSYIELNNLLKPKYISLYSTNEKNCGPIFLRQKFNLIKMKNIDCKHKSNDCLICTLKISKKQIECNFFDPHKSDEVKN
ncbi:4263_t:CDS:2 [Funneliformis mosseae]|uniref:4263_t:CDS:1 n=1 Tax=Funneliformis mosseae TaxID=27381 RepID=A0A9N9CDK3_FUNMO|nr:4263_t:CDS:2 [Funneliformis mosseae]